MASSPAMNFCAISMAPTVAETYFHRSDTLSSLTPCERLLCLSLRGRRTAASRWHCKVLASSANLLHRGDGDLDARGQRAVIADADKGQGQDQGARRRAQHAIRPVFSVHGALRPAWQPP